ncbi:serine hydrolase domain-containing protein [Scleromatobacter humisilvae]|uniref:Beta-lactamase family protein n=1 Tax=Scleromatobacter humisilvae TaxID=2897159 RepID=A0A9X1YMB8_9BURK|nr:serine hydrolase domain-containing protein [Scleromatobacter humisilvae]MCK9688631.1 beta-lactamase family protein [Scleromatobacter humisilvae]
MHSLRHIVVCAALAGAGVLGHAADAPLSPVAPKPGATEAPKAAVAASTGQLPAGTITTAQALTREDLESWLDGLIPSALVTARTPGAVVSIVKDGQVLLEKGYGWADAEKHIPVDPKSTLFRPGSTSKLFTWTAVMQQVELGKLDLDTDVNQYLDFKVPVRNGHPLTLRHIMTQTSGFEEVIKDLVAFDTASPPLRDVLVSNMPPLRADPGTTAGYSNYATALAGYIVQRVSGEPYEDYIEHHIFQPLGMAHSSFRQPLPAALAPLMAQGYMETGQPGHGFEVVNLPPAGSLSSTADDMSRFMIAHLQDGTLGDARILQAATAQKMHTTPTRLFPDLNGIALGFYQQDINGHRVIAHGGDLNYFHSDLALFIDDHVGLFISVNAPGKEGMGEMLRVRLFNSFADRYFPKPETPAPIDKATRQAHAAMIAGTWVNTRRADSTFLKLVDLLSPTHVTANPDGSITSKTLLDPQTFVETAPFLWSEVDGHDKLQARVQDGKVVAWATDSLAFAWSYQSPGGLAAAGLQQAACGLALFIVVLAAATWPIAAVVRRRLKTPRAESPALRLARRLADASAFALLAAVVAWVAFFAAVISTTFTGLDPLLHLAQVIAILGFAGGTLANVWLLVVQLREHKRAGTLAWTAVRVIAFAYLLAVAFGYNLLSLSGHY